MATYAIGDIHGCLTALRTIFNEQYIKPGDTVVFLGDYIDRGPNSKGVFDWLIVHQNMFNFKFILGNHEIMMLTAKDHPDRFAEWLHFGGASTLNSYGIEATQDWAEQINQEHWNFIDNCLPYLEIDRFIFVHAGLEKNKYLDEQDSHHLFWKKYETPDLYDKNKTVICGHTSRKNGEIADFRHTICIDTYAYGGKWLSCLNIETGDFLKANNMGDIETGKLSSLV